MQVICAWCDQDLGSKEPLDDPDVTHGMCGRCAERELALIEAHSQPKED